MMRTLFRWIYNALINRVDTLKLGKLTIKGIAKPTWKDPKTNLIWASWLFITCMKYLFQGLKIKYDSWYKITWFRSLVSVLFLFVSPLRYFFKALSYIRYLRFILLILGGFISFIYNPTEIWYIVVIYNNGYLIIVIYNNGYLIVVIYNNNLKKKNILKIVL